MLATRLKDHVVRQVAELVGAEGAAELLTSYVPGAGGGPAGVLDAVLAERAEQHSGEGAVPAAADNQELRVPAHVEQGGCGVRFNDVQGELVAGAGPEGVVDGLDEGLAGVALEARGVYR